jgi:hypothetical protein
VSDARITLRLWLMSLFGLLAILFIWHRLTGEVPPIVAIVLAAVVLGPVLLLSLLTLGGRSGPTPEQIEARRREIQALLHRLIGTQDELRSLVEAEFANDHSESTTDTAARILAASEELKAEIWFYNTSAERWENLCGECGIAFVRDGKVLNWETWAEN